MKNQVLYLGELQVLELERFVTGRVKVYVFAYGIAITVPAHELTLQPTTVVV